VCYTLNVSQDFIPKLKAHLLGRLYGQRFDGDETEFSSDELNKLRIVNQKIYSVKVFRINYTTYDVRRDMDVINPRFTSNVMVHSPETDANPDAHPYWYARILGVFHAHIFHEEHSPIAQRMEFLWVRWYRTEPDHESGQQHARLPKIGFVPEDDNMVFGFLDPSLVIRAAHLIPSFANGRTNSLLSTTGSTAARLPGETEDWLNYYVGMCVHNNSSKL
jgi:hypothetical protein